MLQNAYFLVKIGADTAENEQHFAENLPIGRRVADRCPAAPSASDSRQACRQPCRDSTTYQRHTHARGRTWVERFGRRGTEPKELFRSEFGQNSWNP